MDIIYDGRRYAGVTDADAAAMLGLPAGVAVMNHELPTLIYHTNSMIVRAQAHTINRMVDNNRPKRPTHTHKHGSTNQSKINH